MILIEAEAKARLTGKESEGHDLLYVLQKNRDVNAVKSTNTGALIGTVEEFMLVGVEWFDQRLENYYTYWKS
jgi:hypothetical protein